MVRFIPYGLAMPESGLFWKSLARYFPSLYLSPEDIDSPRNVITMIISLQYQFCTSLFAFKVIGEHHTGSEIMIPSTISSRCLPEFGKVSFVHHDSRFELPSPVLLEVHASTSRVLHMTRKDCEIDGLMRKWEKTGTLAEHGSIDVEALSAISGFKARTSKYSDDEWVESELCWLWILMVVMEQYVAD